MATNVSAAVIALSIIAVSCPSVGQTTPALSPMDQIKFPAMFQFGRTRYFSFLMTFRGCDRLYRERVAADQKEFRDTSARLARLFGAGFDPDKPVDPTGAQAAPCGQPTVGSFELKIVELRGWADKAEAAAGGK